MRLQEDPSIRPGWTTPYIDGSGWTGMDTVMAREGGWDLEIQTFGIAVHDWPSTIALGYMSHVTPTSFAAGRLSPASVYPHVADKPQYDKDGFSHLLERAVTGDKLSIKALYLMVYNDPEHYSEWRETVDSLQKIYTEPTA